MDFYVQLFQDGTIHRLIERGLLVQTEITDLALDGYELVLRHRCVPFVSYAHEWCDEMLKDAALLIVDLEIELAKDGLTLLDANPLNVLFDGCFPVYVDLGSLVPADRKDWALDPYDEFCRYFNHPLQLMAHGCGRVGRSLLNGSDHQLILGFYLPALIRKPYRGFDKRQAVRAILSVVNKRVPRLIPNNVFKWLHGVLSRPGSRRYSSPLDFLEQLRQRVKDIAVPSLRAVCSKDCEGSYPPFEPSDEWTSKHQTVQRVLSDLRPASVLDIGSHRGWYSQFAALHGCTVVAVDTDEGCVARLYREAKEKNLPVLPLVMSFGSRSPAYSRYTQRLVPATQRLRCELVQALAVVHHLVFEQGLNFEQITDELSAFSNRWLLAEFIPRQDQDARKWWSEKYSWYTLDNFMAALRRKFQSIKVYRSYPDQRVLLLCEK